MVGLVSDDPPVVQRMHAIGERGRLRVVGYEQDRCAVLAADLRQQLEHFAAALGVEVARRLVGEHELRLG